MVCTAHTIFGTSATGELNGLYRSHNIFRVTKSKKMRWAGHVARMGNRRGMFRVLVGNLREIGHLGDPGVDGMILR
jgi:hypothetical protein